MVGLKGFRIKPGMTAGPSKARLSIGIYDRADRLFSSVVKLVDQGFSEAQLGIVALRSTLPRLRSPPQVEIHAHRHVLRLLDEVHPLPGAEGSDFLVASRGPILRFLVDHQGAQAITSPDAGQTTASMRAEIERQIRAGATALAIASRSPDQQWLSTRILLEDSSFPVQTHEFRLPRDDT
jgi:hypothetical protein